MAGDVPRTPRDTNGEGRWRLQEAERQLGAMRSELNALDRSFAIHKTQTEEFQRHSRERWIEDDRRRREREKEHDEWKVAQEKRMGTIQKIAVTAVTLFIAALLAGIVNAVLLVGGS